MQRAKNLEKIYNTPHLPRIPQSSPCCTEFSLMPAYIYIKLITDHNLHLSMLQVAADALESHNFHVNTCDIEIVISYSWQL